MSSTESSGAPAEATATPPAPPAAFASFGSTRGSGLARGKRPSTSPASAATAATSDYTPTAIEVVTSPREYQNPFAPAETPAAVPQKKFEPAPAEPAVAVLPPAATAEAVPAETVRPSFTPAPAKTDSWAAEAHASAPVESVESGEPAELNILPPEQPKSVPAQTWESEGFRPAREPRPERPRREERTERTERAPREERAPIDPASIPAKFLYVRPGYNYVPTPSNFGGAPRERDQVPATPRTVESVPPEAPAKSGGFVGWLKSLFGIAPTAPAADEVRNGESRQDSPYQERRHRGGRGRGAGGEPYASNGEGGGQRRRHRGGRGRNQSRGGDYRGGDQGGPPAT